MLVAEEALRELARELRAEESVITPYVVDPDSLEPSLGVLAAAGPRASKEPGEYALLIETIREGYLLHYGQPRVVGGAATSLWKAAARSASLAGIRERLERAAQAIGFQAHSDLPPERG